ncbi:hypothetical protein CPB83DRAFT_855385 [Crepidotus variabilis]|uniref:Uncharacterized protein n=1 Tax=Crepidotus variabilis TaxID=179855 RepID=A0A9P6EF19_9AGAR|nr:hypothetical protein CPB83DRAFT_855385 [Crepidotus variabilis]
MYISKVLSLVALASGALALPLRLEARLKDRELVSRELQQQILYREVESIVDSILAARTPADEKPALPVIHVTESPKFPRTNTNSAGKGGGGGGGGGEKSLKLPESSIQGQSNQGKSSTKDMMPDLSALNFKG